MLVYHVLWSPDSECIKGRSSKVTSIGFTVLCRNSQDALNCLECLFDKKYVNAGFSLSDGVSTLRRSKLDSRCFYIDYLFMDGIKQPICLHDVKSSLMSLMPRI